MSYALPFTTTIVDKYLQHHNFIEPKTEQQVEHSTTLPAQTIGQIIAKYDSFRELVHIAQMDNILNDPQANMTVFVPVELLLPKTVLKACVGDNIQERDVLSINFELARQMVNSVVVPHVLTTTIMMQSAYTRYRTRDPVNTLTTNTPHSVQFEPQTYNKPPFGIMLNGKARILIPDIVASNGIVHTIDIFPYL